MSYHVESYSEQPDPITFGLWTVLKDLGTRNKRRYLLCQCACGSKPKEVLQGSLRCGSSASCGCAPKRVRSHRESRPRSPEYAAWTAMRARCLNPRHKSYAYYGGRGISICMRWEEFDSFLADMGRRPSALHSLDRYPAKDGNYELANCRWATRKQQQRNLRNNRLITIDGETCCVGEWAERFGLKLNRITAAISYGHDPLTTILSMARRQ